MLSCHVMPCHVMSCCHVMLPPGPCKAGYYCSGGASTSQPLSPSSAGSGDLCTTGHYCPKGSTQPLKCPLGSYMPTVGASNCTACTAGHYCGVIGLSTVSGSCAAGNILLHILPRHNTPNTPFFKHLNISITHHNTPLHTPTQPNIITHPYPSPLLP